MKSQSRFTDYTPDELRLCGQAFRECFENAELSGRRAWTQAVYRWFIDVAPAGIRSYCNPRVIPDGYYEFLVDLCHTTYPPCDDSIGRRAWYERAFSSPLRFRLALECEWDQSSSDQSLVAVLDDAAKLAAVRAESKVMIFGSHSKDHRAQIVPSLERLRHAADDNAPWLWIDVLWQGYDVQRDIQFGVFG